MCCSGYGGSDNKNFPEFTKPFKRQNSAGCCNAGNRNDCDSPSLAKAGSPLARWEAVHGKLITKVWFERDTSGREVQKVEKTACPLETKRPSRHGCCSLSYRVKR